MATKHLHTLCLMCLSETILRCILCYNRHTHEVVVLDTEACMEKGEHGGCIHQGGYQEELAEGTQEQQHTARALTLDLNDCEGL